MGKFGMPIMRNTILSLALLFCLCPNYLAAESAKVIQNSPAKVYQINGNFSDVKEALIFSIENQGLVVSYIAKAGEMLARTSKVTGDKPAVYRRAENVFFCKATLSDKLVRESPHGVVFCPFVVGIYTLNKPQQSPNTNTKTETATDTPVYIRYPRLPKNMAISAEIEKLLESVIQETIEF